MKLLITLFLIFGFTPFPILPTAPDTVATKGGLLTNDGASDVIFSACSDTEIIEWDAAEASGFKCVAKPVDTDTNAGTICASGQLLNGDGLCESINTTSFSNNILVSEVIDLNYTTNYYSAAANVNIDFINYTDGEFTSAVIFNNSGGVITTNFNTSNTDLVLTGDAISQNGASLGDGISLLVTAFVTNGKVYVHSLGQAGAAPPPPGP